jgi:putative colanic acid biosysnthesis UDP-glucose lipid carrier transferase
MPPIASPSLPSLDPDVGLSVTLRDYGRRALLSLPFGSIAPLRAGVDVAAILLCNTAAAWVARSLGFGAVSEELLAASGLCMSVLFVVIAASRGLYSERRALSARQQASGAATTWMLAFAAFASLAFTLKFGSLFSRASITILFVMGLASLPALRFGWSRWLAHAYGNGLITCRRVALLVIEGEPVDEVMHGLQSSGRQVTQLWAAKSLRSRRVAEQLGRALQKKLVASAIDELILVSPTRRMAFLRNLAEELRLAPLQVRLIVDHDFDWLAQSVPTRVADRAVIDISRAPLSRFECLLKRTMDIVIAATALVVLAPVMLAAIVAIKLETAGPAIFRQRRHGFNNETFLIYKFRSMRVAEDGPVVTQASRHDARVTRVGRFIRRTSIDELPQLLNVLRGEMSIVGPRPHAVAHGEIYSTKIGDYAHRHHVKPGLTGWAQVNGSAGETPTVESMERRVNLDLWYISHWTIWLDVSIILRTIKLAVTGRGAF